MLELDYSMYLSTQYSSLVNRIKALPLWVKQAIICDLRNDIKDCTELSFVDTKSDYVVIQHFRPAISQKARRILENKDEYRTVDQLNTEHRYFLNSARSHMNMVEIAHANHWSLKQTCNILLDLVMDDLLEQIPNKNIHNSILYLTDKINLAVYLLRIKKLSNDDYNKALYTKKCTEDMNCETTLTEVLVNLGYLTHNELANIVALKESSEHAVDTIDPGETISEENMYLNNELENQKFRHSKLEEQIEFYKKELENAHNENLELRKQLNKYASGILGKIFLTLSQ